MDTARAASWLVRVQLGEEVVQLRLKPDAVSSLIPDRTVAFEDGVEISIPIQMKHRQGALIVDAPSVATIAGRIDRALVRAVALARSWADRLASGEASSLNELAAGEGYCRHYAARLLPLAWLAPDLVEMILAGRQPVAVSLAGLTRMPLPLAWEAQRAIFAECGS